MDAVELLLWLLLVIVAVVAIGLASVACMGERDEDEERTSATQSVSTSKSVAEELFSPDQRVATKRVKMAGPIYYVPSTIER